MQGEMKYVHYHPAAAIYEHNVGANHDVLVARWGWRKHAHELSRARLDMPSQAWRQGAAHDELSFQAGWQAVFSGQSWRKVIVVVVIPFAEFRAFVLPVKVISMVVLASAPVSLVVAVFVPVSVAVPVTMPVVIVIAAVAAVAMISRENRVTGK